MKEIKNVPQLRFSRYNDDWEEKKLGEVSSKVTKKNINHTITETFTNSAEFGIISQRDFFDHDISNDENIDGYFIVENDDFVYNPRISTIAPVGPINRNKLGRSGVMSPLYYVFRTHDIDKTFLEKYFKSECWYDFMFLNGNSGARSDRFSITDSVFSQMPIRVPCNEIEQQKIGSLLSHVDSLIQAKTKKLESLKAVKKSLLQKCFPKAGEKVPEMRFAGFSGEWEEKKLGEIGETKSGIGFPDKEQGGIEGIPFFKVSDMNSDGNEYELTVANNYVTEEQINRNNWNIIKNIPAVFFAKVGAAVMLNRKRLIRTPFLLDNNTMAYIFDKSIWDCDFGKHLFETIDLTKLTQVGALPSYNGSDVENLQIYLPPSVAEQQKIGQFFSKYDSLISAQQKEIDKHKDIKKSLLQKMFI